MSERGIEERRRKKLKFFKRQKKSWESCEQQETNPAPTSQQDCIGFQEDWKQGLVRQKRCIHDEQRQ